MSLAVISIVLASAMMHAGWNAVLRFRGDRVALMTMLAAMSALIALPGLFFVDFPRAEAWPWLALSVALHVGYNVFLANAYAYGELGKIYPLARGTAPMLTLGASIFLLGEDISPLATLGILVLGLGIVTLSLDGGLKALKASPRGIVFAFITSVFIAGYTMSDGIGARAAQDAHSYVLWLFVLDGIPLLLWALVRQGRATGQMIAQNWKAGFVAGALSLGAYWIAIWGFTVAPIALVAALRETSVIFAVIIGVVFLGEKMRGYRILAIGIVLAGLVLMRF
ncbi:EamA family transporter [Aliihoeflea aestuarii]|jgi:drug/metabolite transporter (DMT)-like permease|uniref:EamA family transporter n=1 Tax=Aliihoeflea aestuarii TaxID=453840 RepID=UPI0020942275|nr:EamA family transporter [Aliihoeflea aestuarii]MCO6392856.1 EamA family transporter [Aliihoeflea aestuarii]